MSADASGRPALVADPAEIRRFVLALRQPGEVIELRALEALGDYGSKRGTCVGYFRVPDHADQLVAGAVEATEQRTAKGVYVTVNPVPPALLSLYHARLQPFAKNATLDKEIEVRTWLPVDLDSRRPAGISSTDDEKAAAFELIGPVKAFMAGKGFAPPIVSDSGNGYHLLFPLEPLPADDGGRVKRVLEALAARFDTPKANVDTSMFNPSRIVKLPGTVVRKGDDTPDRPHRVARTLDMGVPA